MKNGKMFCLGLVVWTAHLLPVLAWDGEGHMLVAQIAYNHLSPAVKARCDALAALPVPYSSSYNSTFVTCSCWADDAKGSLGTGTWHYIDLPFSLDGTSTNSFVPLSFDVVKAINLYISVLLDPTVDPTNQAIALRYLAHFVGDIQQPLHSSTAISASATHGDAGGNGFSVSGWGNLHSLWDSGGGYLTDSISRPINSTGQSILDTKAAQVEGTYPYIANIGSIPDPMAWALEGWQLAQSVAYTGITAGSAPSIDYLTSVQATTLQRMAAGGHRLADLLNTVFAPIQLSASNSPQTIFLSWNAMAGQTYHVQVKGQLSDSWAQVADVIAATNEASFSNSLSGAQGFYRVVQ